VSEAAVNGLCVIDRIYHGSVKLFWEIARLIWYATNHYRIRHLFPRILTNRCSSALELAVGTLESSQRLKENIPDVKMWSDANGFGTREARLCFKWRIEAAWHQFHREHGSKVQKLL
jgi:hypothetical protein